MSEPTTKDSRIWVNQPAFTYRDDERGKLEMDDVFEKVDGIRRSSDMVLRALDRLHRAALAREAAHEEHRLAAAELRRCLDDLDNAHGKARGIVR